MAHKTLVNGTAYEISGGKTLVDGTTYEISGGKTLVNGTAYNIEFGGKYIRELDVGSSVFLNVSGVPTEFLLVNIDSPSQNGYSPIDGVWLLMKDIYIKEKWATTTNIYDTSSINNYLNETFINKLDEDVRNIIRTVSLPCTRVTDLTGSVEAYPTHYNSKIFLLSVAEVFPNTEDISNMMVEGSILQYFSDNDATKRGALFGSSETPWWSRSPRTNNTKIAFAISKDGVASYTVTNTMGIRPAMILRSEAKIDSNFNVIV